LDLRGSFNAEKKEVEWIEPPKVVVSCRPYLVGYAEAYIEIKNVFSPNKVIQKLSLRETQAVHHSVARNEICNK